MHQILVDILNSGVFDIYEHTATNAVNVKELSKTGTISEKEEINNGVITKTITYKSFDGKREFTKEISYLKENENEFELNKLRDLIDLSVKIEDFESATEYQKEINKLINKTK